MSLPFPPPGTEFTFENVRKYAMLRPQYEYDGSPPFPCLQRRSFVPREKDWGCWWPGPTRMDNFYDYDPDPEPDSEEWPESIDDWVSYDEEYDDFMSDSDEEYAEYMAYRQLHHVPRRRMGWLAGFASRGVPSNIV